MSLLITFLFINHEQLLFTCHLLIFVFSLLSTHCAFSKLSETKLFRSAGKEKADKKTNH